LALITNGNLNAFFEEIFLEILDIITGNSYFCHDFAMSRLQFMGEAVNHQGVIERIEGPTIYVKVARQSACTGCHAKSMCMVADGKEQIIEVIDYSGAFHVNEVVMLSGETSMGLQAVGLAFVIPLVLVVAVIILGTNIQWKESTSALAGLLLLFPYYIILYFLRGTLKKKFIFSIKKINL
jgi:sigma-E factor negative regulatory protein RseC